MGVPRRLGVWLAGLLLLAGCTGCSWRAGTLEGQVVDAGGRPVARAQVAVFTSDPEQMSPSLDRVAWAATSAQGRFRVRLAPGSYSVSVTDPERGLGHRERLRVEAGTRRTLAGPIQLEPGACQLEGRIEGPSGHPLDATVVLLPVSPEYRPMYHQVLMAKAPRGRFRLAVPAGRYRFIPHHPGWWSEGAWVDVKGPRQTLHASLLPNPSTAPGAVKAFIRDHAVPLTTCEPHGEVEELEAMAGMFGSARLIGLGEASHGTHQMLRLKHRILEGCPQFTAIAMELSQAAGFYVDAFIREGGPEPWAQLPGSLQHEEFRDLVRWLRAIGQDPVRPRTIRFYGFDVDDPGPAFRWALGHLGRTRPGEARFLQAKLGNLPTTPCWTGPLPAPGQVQAWKAALDELEARVPPGAHATAAGRGQAAKYRRCLRLLRQFVELTPDRLEGARARERFMAENLDWVLHEEGPRAKVLLSAHNGHVTRAANGRSGYPALGWHLAQAYGQDYRAFALLFGGGAFHALEEDGGQVRTRLFQVSPVQGGTLDQALAATGEACFALDLHRLPDQGPVARWFRAPQGTWSIATRFAAGAPHESISTGPVTDAFDGLFFIRETTGLNLLERPPNPSWAAR